MLSIRNVSKSFGGVHALRAVDMQIAPGAITSVIGPNGAGKSTLMNVISGFTPPTNGEVQLDGTRISGQRPHRICRMGIARSFQNLQMFSDMPVWEVAASGRYRHQTAGLVSDLLQLPRSRAEQREAATAAEELLCFVGLDVEYWHRRAGDLSYGLQRKLEIARALATAPRWILLDEPAAGLNTAETVALAGLFEKITDRGVSVVLIEHDLELVMEVSHDIYVMDAGAVISHGSADVVRNDPKVISAYLGVAADG